MQPIPPLYARGPYRVVDGEHAYLVLDTAGTRLYEELTFEAARARVDRRIEEQEREHAPRHGGRAR